MMELGGDNTMRAKQFAGICAVVLLLVAAPNVWAQSEVANAAMRGQNAQIATLLGQGADVNGAQGDGATALHWAAYRSDFALARTLLNAGANASAASRNGSTPLWLAATNGDAAMLGLLLENGADANESLPLGRTPLMIAARTGNPAAVRVLLEAGANVNAAETARGTTPLMWAADQGHADVTAILIEAGADIDAVSAPAPRNARNNIGKDNDPRNQVRQQVERILEAQLEGADGPVSGLPGQLEREREDPPQAQAQAGQGGRGGRGNAGQQAGNNPGNQDGNNPAAAAGADGATAEARPGDADFQGFDRQERGTPRDGGELTALVYAARVGSIDTVRTLLDAGADVNQVTNYGWSALLAATQNRNYQLARFLIDNGADVNLANDGGWTPLYLATDNRNIEDGDYPTRQPDMGDLEYIQLLLDSGAEVNARMVESSETRTVFTNQWLDEEGATAFLRASQSGDVDLMRLLLEHGADPFINTELNVTPLQVAAGIGWVEGVTREHSTAKTVEAVQLLLDLGVDPNVQADTGRTALHGAAHKGATEVVQLLVEAGARMDVRDYGNTDNRGSPELAAHTWLPVDYADGLVRVGVQSAIPHPETGQLLRDLMAEVGLEAPPMGRTLDSICIVEVCDLFPVAIFGENYAEENGLSDLVREEEEE
jgi:ankyrin repeat protein